MKPTDQLEMRARVALAVVAARRAGVSKEVVVHLVAHEWRRLDEAEAAQAAGARATARRGPKRGGGVH